MSLKTPRKNHCRREVGGLGCWREVGCWAEEAQVPSLFSLQILVLVTSPLVFRALLDMGGWVLGFWYTTYSSVMPRSGISNYHRLKITHLVARVTECSLFQTLLFYR